MTATGSHFDFDSLRGAPLARNDFVLYGHFAILRQLLLPLVLRKGAVRRAANQIKRLPVAIAP